MALIRFAPLRANGKEQKAKSGQPIQVRGDGSWVSGKGLGYRTGRRGPVVATFTPQEGRAHTVEFLWGDRATCNLVVMDTTNPDAPLPVPAQAMRAARSRLSERDRRQHRQHRGREHGGRDERQASGGCEAQSLAADGGIVGLKAGVNDSRSKSEYSNAANDSQAMAASCSKEFQPRRGGRSLRTTAAL